MKDEAELRYMKEKSDEDFNQKVDDMIEEIGKLDVISTYLDDADRNVPNAEVKYDEHYLNEDDTELSDLYILDFSPSLKTLCKLAVIQHGLQQSGLPHDIRWELEAMTTNSTSKHDEKKKEDNGKEQVPGNGTGPLHLEGIEIRAQECAHAAIPTKN